MGDTEPYCSTSTLAMILTVIAAAIACGQADVSTERQAVDVDDSLRRLIEDSQTLGEQSAEEGARQTAFYPLPRSWGRWDEEAQTIELYRTSRRTLQRQLIFAEVPCNDSEAQPDCVRRVLRAGPRTPIGEDPRWEVINNPDPGERRSALRMQIPASFIGDKHGFIWLNPHRNALLLDCRAQRCQRVSGFDFLRDWSIPPPPQPPAGSRGLGRFGISREPSTSGR